jgi:hypothetical protein
MKSLECQSLQSRPAIRKHLIRERVAAVSLLCRQIELYGGRIQKSEKAMQLRQQVEAELKAVFGQTSSPAIEQLRTLPERPWYRPRPHSFDALARTATSGGGQSGLSGSAGGARRASLWPANLPSSW